MGCVKRKKSESEALRLNFRVVVACGSGKIGKNAMSDPADF